MSDPKEKEVQAILQAIDYGHLPPRETQRRLLNIIQAEAARTDAPTDETKIHTCNSRTARRVSENTDGNCVQSNRGASEMQV